MVGRGADGARALREAAGLSPGGYGVLSPGASLAQAYKKPPATLLVAACRALAARGLGALVVWGPGEKEDARRVVDEAGGDAILSPPTGLPELAALIHDSALFAGGDSGPLHVACAVGCPVVGIYGPTDPVVNQPWGVPYRTVFPSDRAFTGIKKIDRRAGGFDGLHADAVLAAATELIGETAPGRTREPGSPPGYLQVRRWSASRSRSAPLPRFNRASIPRSSPAYSSYQGP